MQLGIKAMMWCFSLCVVTLHGYHLADVPEAAILSTWNFLPPKDCSALACSACGIARAYVIPCALVGMISVHAALKSKAFTITSFSSHIFLTRYYRRELRALLPLGLPSVTFVWERHWGAAMYDGTWHLLSFGCYGNFGHFNTTGALQAGTEQRSSLTQLYLT